MLCPVGRLQIGEDVQCTVCDQWHPVTADLCDYWRLVLMTPHGAVHATRLYQRSPGSWE